MIIFFHLSRIIYHNYSSDTIYVYHTKVCVYKFYQVLSFCLYKITKTELLLATLCLFALDNKLVYSSIKLLVFIFLKLNFLSKL